MSNNKYSFDLSPVSHAIGTLVVNFNSTEQSLRNIAFLLIDSSDNRIGGIVVDRLNSANIEDLVRALSEYRLRHNLKLSEKVDALIARFSDLRSRRNEIVHAVWRIPNNSTDAGDVEAVRLQLRKGTVKHISSISPDTINAAASEASSMCADLDATYAEVRDALLAHK